MPLQLQDVNKFSPECFICFRFNKPSRYTSDELRQPSNFLHTYKALDLLLNELTRVVRPYALMLVNNTMITLCVGGQITFIELHHKIDMEALLGFLGIFVGSILYLIITYFKFGEINEFSVKCIGSWKRNDGYTDRPQDRQLIKRYVRSLRTCRVDLGDFGYYRRANSLRIVGKVIYYTTKGITLIQKFL